MSHYAIDRNWLLFAEDPGALNYFVPLVKAISKKGIAHRFFTTANALPGILGQGIEAEIVSGNSIQKYCEQARLVVTGTSENKDSSAFSIIHEASKAGIPTVSIVDSGVNAAYRFRGHTDNPIAFAPDYIFVPDAWSKNEYLTLGVDAYRLQIIGQLPCSKGLFGETHAQMRQRLFPSLDPLKKMIVFVSEISDGLNSKQYLKSNEYTLEGRGSSNKRSQIVAEEFLHGIREVWPQEMEPPHLVLRLHPKEQPADLGQLSEEFDFISMHENPLELVYCADLVVGMTSMLLNEACWMGQACLSIVPRPKEKAWLPVTRTGEIPCAHERKEIHRFLAAFCNAPHAPWGEGNNKSNDLPFNPEHVVQILEALNNSKRIIYD